MPTTSAPFELALSPTGPDRSAWLRGVIPTVLAIVSLCASGSAGSAQTQIIANFGGVNLSNTFALGSPATPPDTMGAIGPNNFTEFVNGAFANYTRTGTLAQPMVSDTAFWAAAGISASTLAAGLSDPRIIYDPLSSRWFATQITTSNTGNMVLLARTNGINPSIGNWVATQFTGNAGFADYPTLGVDSRGVFIGSNNFTSSVGNFSGVTLTSIPKADLLLAAPTVANRTTFNDPAANLGFTLQGVTNRSASSTSHVVAISASAFNVANRTVINNPQAAGATLGATQNINIAFDGNPTFARQPDGTRQIDALDDRFSASVIQVGNKIYAVNAINNGNFGGQTAPGFNSVHWIILDATTGAVLKEGLIQDGVHDFFQPSISANANGVIVIGFDRSGTETTDANGDGFADGNISSYAVVGTTDSLGNVTFDTPLLLAAGAVSNYHLLGGAGERWGDYSATVLDPNDSDVFWTIQEIPGAKVGGQDRWSTQITAIRVTQAIQVPEPSPLLLLGAAGIPLFLVARRRPRDRALTQAA